MSHGLLDPVPTFYFLRYLLRWQIMRWHYQTYFAHLNVATRSNIDPHIWHISDANKQTNKQTNVGRGSVLPALLLAATLRIQEPHEIMTVIQTVRKDGWLTPRQIDETGGRTVVS